MNYLKIISRYNLAAVVPFITFSLAIIIDVYWLLFVTLAVIFVLNRLEQLEVAHLNKTRRINISFYLRMTHRHNGRIIRPQKSH